jgi:alcohol dehydrogenase
MRSARALVLEKPRTLVAREFPIPEHGDDDAVLRVEACGLCGTDHEQYTGHLAGGFAFVPGHETVGVLESIGDLAAQRWGVAAGDRVAVEVFQSCRACDACRAGMYQRCERHGLADMYGYIPVDKPPGLWGGYAESQYLGPDTIVHRIPDVLDPVAATLFNPVGAGVRWAVTVPGTSVGDVVAVLGPGVRGLSAAAAAKDAGAGFVMVTGRGQRDGERLAVAADFGADLAVDVADTDPVRALRDATGGRADVVVDVTAKAPEAFAQAVALARPGGTVVVAGTRGGPVREFQPDHIVFKELRIVGALGVDSDAYRAALALLASGRYPFADLPRRVAALDDAEELIRSLAGESDSPPPVHGVIAPA